jgi:hypothetical protein
MNAAQIGQNEFNTMTAQEQPYMNAGYGAQSQLNYLMGIGSNGQAQPQTAPQGGGAGQPYGRMTASGYQGGIGGAYGSGIGLDRGRGGGGAGAGGDTTAAGGYGAPSTSSPGGSYGSLLSPFSIAKFHEMSPAYQFEKQQLQQGVLNGDSSSMGALSGAAQSDLAKQTGQFANESFNTAFNQYQTQQGNIYSRLAGISQLGQNAASNTGAQGTALAGNIGQSVASAGAAQAAGQVGVANAWSGAANNALPWLASSAGAGGGGFGGMTGGNTPSMSPGGN